MIKIILTLITLSLSTPCWAKNTSLFEVRFNQKNINHKYNLLFNPTKQQYILKSVQNKKTHLNKLSSMQAKSLQSYVNSIAWDGQFRKPSSIAKCTTYVTLKNTTAKATICKEDYANTGKALGLLNELDRLTSMKK